MVAASFLFVMVLAQAVNPDATPVVLVISPVQMFTLAGFLSGLGGMTSAFLDPNWKTQIVLAVTVRTGILGACLSMVAYYWVATDPKLTWVAIGVIGLLGLSGESSIKFVIAQLQDRIRRNNES